MKTNNIILSAFLSLIFASCSNDDYMDTSNRMNVEFNTIFSSINSRIAYDENKAGDIDLKWQQNDVFSIFTGSDLQVPSTFSTSAEKLGVFNGELSADTQNGTTLYAVYPSLTKESDPKALSHDISSQSLIDGKLSLNSQCLVASTSFSNKGGMSFSFKNETSMLKLSIELPSDLDKALINQVVLSNSSLINNAIIDITSSDADWTNPVFGDIKINLSKNLESDDELRVPVVDNILTIYTIVFPQTLPGLSVKLLDSSENILAQGEVMGNATIERSKKYNVDIKVNEIKTPPAEEEYHLDFTKGDSEEDAILIKNALNLCEMYDYYNGDIENVDPVANKYYKVANDIDLSELPEGKVFRPIGANSGKEFTGNLDGNGKKIFNCDPVFTDQRSGFIGRMASGSLKNLTVSGNIAFSINNPKSTSIIKCGGIIGEIIKAEPTTNISGELVSEMKINIESSADDTSILIVGGVIGATANSTNINFLDDTKLVYGLSSEADVLNDDKTFTGINVIGGAKKVCIGGIFGESSSKINKISLYNYAKEINGIIQTGDDVNIAVGGLFGSMLNPKSISTSESVVTSNVKAEYKGIATCAVLAGGICGWDKAAQAVTLTSFTVKGISVNALSASQLGLVSSCAGIAAMNYAAPAIPTVGANNYKNCSKSSVVITATGGELTYVDLVAQ